MAARSSFYASGNFQRGGVPLATVPTKAVYPANAFGFKPAFVTANGNFVQSGYGGPLGWSTSWIPLVRYTRSDLAERKANVSTYDHYDATTAMISAGRNYTDIEAFPNYSQFTALASNDSAALLKTAYWLAIGFLTLNDTSLRDTANERLESGLQSGVDLDSANRNTNIKTVYDSAYSLLDKAIKRHGGSNEVAVDALERLRQGTDRKAITARVDEALKQTAARKEVENDLEKAPDVPCASTWRVLIPGYCALQEANKWALYGVKAAGLLLVGGAIYLGVKKFKATRSNPMSESHNPDKKAPMPARAAIQERELAKTVFVRVK